MKPESPGWGQGKCFSVSKSTRRLKDTGYMKEHAGTTGEGVTQCNNHSDNRGHQADCEDTLGERRLLQSLKESAEI